jgi:decaprenylphospho-beta-D-erythro-pentofuranosid-2-ulose 2-reductase
MNGSNRPWLLILGAGSDIAAALATEAARAGYSLILAARNPSKLSESAESLCRRYGVEIVIREFDVLAIESHAAFLDGLLPLPEIVVCLVGLLGNQTTAERSFAEAELILRSNLIGPVSILSEIANRMEARGHGAIVGVSSVAGDRGRAENYLYGAAKAGLTTFLSGLRQRLARSSVRVVTIKPGMVRTKMTSGRRGFFLAEPDRVAPALLAACLRANGVVYLPWYWRPLMALARSIPEALFRQLPTAEKRLHR